MKPILSHSEPFPLPTLADPEFAALPPNERQNVRAWCRRMRRVWSQRPITGALQRMCKATGVGYTTATRKYYLLRNSGGDWRTLINHRNLSTMTHTVRVPVLPSGIQVAILAHTDTYVLLQIRRPEKAGKDVSGKGPKP